MRWLGLGLFHSTVDLLPKHNNLSEMVRISEMLPLDRNDNSPVWFDFY